MMLWQPSLPDRYTRASPADLARDIEARRKELGESLVILGHHYQVDEIIAHADFTGDSLKLSQTAAKIAAERPVKWVVFCGVHFMAETADMLTPEHVEVILPDLSAGCSMADMAAYEDTVEAWERIHASLGKGWKGRIIPITYVNSTAAIKAFVGAHGGACCTSSNAARVFEWAMNGGDGVEGTDYRASAAGGRRSNEVDGSRVGGTVGGARDDVEDIKILFLPDQHLGRNTAAAYGVDVGKQTVVYDPKRTARGDELGGATAEQIRDAKVILWAGHCSVHKLFRPEHCDEIRAKFPGMKILVHPECCKEVVDKADLNGSTEFIIKTLRGAEAGSKWAVGTEVHLVKRLARECEERGVEVRILSECQCLCTTMYRIDQPHLLWVLDNLAGEVDGKKGKPKVVNAVRVHPEVRKDAVLALERMLRLTGVKSLAHAD